MSMSFAPDEKKGGGGGGGGGRGGGGGGSRAGGSSGTGAGRSSGPVQSGGMTATGRTVTNTIGGKLSINLNIPGTKIGVSGEVSGSRTSTTTFAPKK
jgi:hypothetical protein